MCLGVRPEGWLRWFAHPLGDVECRDHAQYPAFAPSTSEVAVGFFVSFVQFLPQLRMYAVLFSPYSFFVFCCSCMQLFLVPTVSLETFVQVQTLQQRGPGPILSHPHSLSRWVEQFGFNSLLEKISVTSKSKYIQKVTLKRIQLNVTFVGFISLREGYDNSFF